MLPLVTDPGSPNSPTQVRHQPNGSLASGAAGLLAVQDLEPLLRPPAKEIFDGEAKGCWKGSKRTYPVLGRGFESHPGKGAMMISHTFAIYVLLQVVAVGYHKALTHFCVRPVVGFHRAEGRNHGPLAHAMVGLGASDPLSVRSWSRIPMKVIMLTPD